MDGVTSTKDDLNLVDGSSSGTIVNGKAVVYGSAGEVNAIKLQISGTDVNVTAAEFNCLDNVSSNIQTQLDNKHAKITSSATLDSALIGAGLVSNVEFGYLNGVTSAVQTQLDNKATKGFAIAMAIAL
jgi:hypothetical protein